MGGLYVTKLPYSAGKSRSSCWWKNREAATYRFPELTLNMVVRCTTRIDMQPHLSCMLILPGDTVNVFVLLGIVSRGKKLPRSTRVSIALKCEGVNCPEVRGCRRFCVQSNCSIWLIFVR